MRRSLLFSVVLVLGVALTVSGQDLRARLSVSPFAGLGLPIGDMANNDADYADYIDDDAFYRKMGFKFGIAVDYYFTSNLGAGLHFRYATFASKDIDFGGIMVRTDDRLHLTMFGAHGKYVFVPDGMVQPYGIIGAGLVMSTIKNWRAYSILLEKDLDDFGIYMEEVDMDINAKPYLILGGGVTCFVSPTISLFGEFTIDYLFWDGAKMEVDGEQSIELPVTAVEQLEFDTNYYFFDIVVGLSIWFGCTE